MGNIPESMAYHFPKLEPIPGISHAEWNDWKWHFKNALKSEEDFSEYFDLTAEEKNGFLGANRTFQIRSTPYYAQLAKTTLVSPAFADPIRKILVPHEKELQSGHQSLLDPLGEKQHSPVARIVHRYPDRVLFLVTDFCSVYCRFCTRKHFTGKSQAFAKLNEYENALAYIAGNKKIKEVILSGGDPLSLSDDQLEKVLSDIRKIQHVDIIRLGTRMPVVAPMRITDQLVAVVKRNNPVFVMTHFSHPREITWDAANALTRFVDAGIPVMNQFALLNGINNHPAIVEALCRRLLYLRVKPYYMFQCDPSQGTDHLRTSIDNSLWIQKQLWGKMSGLATPTLSMDIPGGGGKVNLVSNAEISKSGGVRTFHGWDGFVGDYVSPPENEIQMPADIGQYEAE